MIHHFSIYDPRYLEDKNRAVCFEVCDTLEEARQNKDDYGDNNVIVKEWIRQTSPLGEYPIKVEVYKSEIVT